MRTQEFGLVAVGRFMAVESYWQSHQSSSSDPRRSLGSERAGGRDGKPDSSGGTGAPAQARHR